MRILKSAMLERGRCFRCRCPLCSACQKSGGGVCPDCYATGGGVGTAAGRMDCPDLGKDRQNPFINFIAKRPGGLLAASFERASKKLHVEVDDDEEKLSEKAAEEPEEEDENNP